MGFIIRNLKSLSLVLKKVRHALKWEFYFEKLNRKIRK